MWNKLYIYYKIPKLFNRNFFKIFEFFSVFFQNATYIVIVLNYLYKELNMSSFIIPIALTLFFAIWGLVGFVIVTNDHSH